MKFGELTVQNFMSVREATFNFMDKGLVLIQGSNEDADSFESNGAGKSTIFSEAPTWTLSGETIRGQKGDKVINRTVGRDTRVSLELIDDNGDTYEIIRHRKHREYKNQVLLFRNGENITGRSDSETNLMIEDLIQMDYSTFTNSIMFGQGVSKMFALSTDGEQKKILEKMLQIDVYKECQDKAKDYLAITEQAITDTESDMQSYYRERKSLEESIESLQEKEAELEKKVQTMISELNLEYEGYEKELENIPDDTEFNEDFEMFTDLENKLNDRLKVYEKHEDSKNDLVAEERSIERDIAQANRNLTQKEKELKDIKNNKNVPKTCRACGQDLPLDDTSHLENHLRDDIAELEKDLDVKITDLEEIKGLITSVNSLLEGKSNLDKQRNEIQEARREITTTMALNKSRRDEINK